MKKKNDLQTSRLTGIVRKRIRLEDLSLKKLCSFHHTEKK